MAQCMTADDAPIVGASDCDKRKSAGMTPADRRCTTPPKAQGDEDEDAGAEAFGSA